MAGPTPRQPVARERPRFPKAESHRLAAAEGREPAEPDGEDGDEEDAGEEHGHGDAEHAEPEDCPRAARPWSHSAIDPRRHGQEQHDQARGEHELEARRELGEDHLERRALVDGGGAEIAFDRAAEIARELHRPRVVQPEFLAQRLALGFRHRLAHDLAQRIAECRAHGKGNRQDRQHDERGLSQAPREEGKPRCETRHRP